MHWTWSKKYTEFTIIILWLRKTSTAEFLFSWGFCQASSQSGTTVKKKTNHSGTGLVPDKDEAVQHILVLYKTEVMDAGMPMPALVSSIAFYIGGALKNLF
jgi:hypothetical protein